MQIQTMTLDEKLTLSNRALALKEAGDNAGYERLTRAIPLPPYLAKIAKRFMGAEFLTGGGWNLSEADAEFGPDWLSK